MFLDHLLNSASSDVHMSLNSNSIGLKDQFQVDISKQGINNRYTEEATLYLKSILQQLCFKSDLSIDDGWFGYFNTIRIKDSTKFVLPEDFLKNNMVGLGGVSSKSASCIQYEYDLKTGFVHDLNITSANRSDANDAKETQCNISQNDLVIRDLGYFSLDVFSEFNKKGAYLISKLNMKTTVYELKQGKYIPIEFDQLYALMKEQKVQQIEKQVYIGTQAKLPVRLIISLIPEEIFNKRLRRTNKHNKERGYNTSNDYINRARFNLIITNVPIEMVPSKSILALYRMRWQIELVFKIWKSTFGIHKTGKMKFHRWLCSLYAKLILIITYWQLIMPLRAMLYYSEGRLLSLDKCYKTLKKTTWKFRDAVTKGSGAIDDFNKGTVQILSSKHWLEKKKKKINYEQIMYLYYCVSGIYVYI